MDNILKRFSQSVYDLDLYATIRGVKLISKEIIPEKLYLKILEVIIESSGAESASLILESENNLFVVSESITTGTPQNLKNITLNSFPFLPVQLISYVFKTNSIVVYADIKNEVHKTDNYFLNNDIRSVACIPLEHNNIIIGVIYLENKLLPEIFTKDRIEYLKIILSLASISIENSRLYSSLESSIRKQTRAETEIHFARMIQEFLLPKNPIMEGFELSPFMKTAIEVGGDYYDVIREGGRDWVIIGDVSGHGVTSGLVMMMTQTAIHTAIQVNENLSTAEILKHINYTITKNIQKIKLNTYITLTLLARENNKFYYSGKHLDIPIFRKKSQTLEIIPTFGSWLGMEDYFNEFDVREFEFEKGDIAFLYTDGLIEAIEIENPRKGLEKAYQIFLESCRKNFSTEDILRALQKEFKGIEPSDDITYLILKKI